MHLAAQDQLAEIQGIDGRKHGDACLHQREGLIHPQAEWQPAELLGQQGMVRRLDAAAERILDHLVALVHGLFDQRIAAQGTDHVQPRHAGLVAGTEYRQRRDVCIGEADAAGFDEFPRWHCPDAGDDPVALDAGLALFPRQRQGVAAAIRAGLQPDHRRLVGTLQPPLRDALEYQVEVTLLDPVELVAAIDDQDAVLPGQRHRILDGRITGPDDHDGLIPVLVRVVQGVLHAGQVFAGYAKSAWIALHADCQDHVLRVDTPSVFQTEDKGRGGTFNGDHLGTKADVDPLLAEPGSPAGQDVLAGSGRKRQRTPERQGARLGHHVLAFLVALDGIRVGGARLQQDVGDTQFCRVGRRAESPRSRADDGQRVAGLRHGAVKPAAPVASKTPPSSCRLKVRPAPAGAPLPGCAGPLKNPLKMPDPVP